MTDTGYKGILNARFVRKLLDRNRRLRPWRFDKKMDEMRKVIDRLVTSILDLNSRVVDLSVVVTALLDLLEAKQIVTEEEIVAYRTGVALRASGLKCFDVNKVTV